MKIYIFCSLFEGFELCDVVTAGLGEDEAVWVLDELVPELAEIPLERQARPRPRRVDVHQQNLLGLQRGERRFLQKDMVSYVLPCFGGW